MRRARGRGPESGERGRRAGSGEGGCRGLEDLTADVEGDDGGGGHGGIGVDLDCDEHLAREEELVEAQR